MSDSDNKPETDSQSYLADLFSRIYRKNRVAKTIIPVAAGTAVAGCNGLNSEVIMPETPVPCDGNNPGNGPINTDFQQIIDKEPKSRFTRMDESNQFDWLVIALASSGLHRKNAPKAIINLLQQNSRFCFAFPVNMMEHSLQTATRAVLANAGDDLILAALLHDMAIPISYPGHAQISAAIIRPYVSDAAYKAVLHHEEFALAHYGNAVGEPTDMRYAYQAEDWFETAVTLVDEWIQVSYDPGFSSYPLEEFIPLIEDTFKPHDASIMEMTMDDCFIESTP